MKSWVVFHGAVLALFTLSSSAAINSASQDILKMAQSGVSEQVLENYVNNSSMAYNLNADDILFLQQNGVPQPVISTMISHDSAIGQQQAPYAQPAPDQQQYVQQEQPYQQPVDQYSGQPQVNPPDVYATGDQPVVEVNASQAPPQVASFYDALRPYGNWIYLQGYGWCWQPYEAQNISTWQPYCDDGSWLYCDDGWYWQSSYNWGWAPFHYGRWWHANCGWVWFPDTIWAPSWVCWRDYDTYCGWAPLPPSGFIGYGRPGFHFGVDFNIGLGAGFFTFIHLGDIFDGHYHHHEIPRTQVTQIFNRTRIINNVTIVNNRYARNPGISRQTVQRVVGHPIRVANVRTSTADPRVNRPGVVRNGSQVSIVRPATAPTPVRNTQIVAHRLPATARSVPKTPPERVQRNISTPRQNVREQPRTTVQQNERLQSPRASENPRTFNNTPRATENPRVSATPRATTTPRVTETPRPNNPRVNELPRNTNPRITETPRQQTPRASELPRPTPRVSETPHPNQTPHVSEVPLPNQPHIQQTPRISETPRPHPAPRATPAAPEVHRAAPEVTPRVEAPRPAVREPAGAQPLPHVQEAPRAVPHAEVPRFAPQPHMSAPPAPHFAPPAAAPHAVGPPPGRGPDGHGPDGRRDH